LVVSCSLGRYNGTPRPQAWSAASDLPVLIALGDGDILPAVIDRQCECGRRDFS